MYTSVPALPYTVSHGTQHALLLVSVEKLESPPNATASCSLPSLLVSRRKRCRTTFSADTIGLSTLLLYPVSRSPGQRVDSATQKPKKTKIWPTAQKKGLWRTRESNPAPLAC